MESKNGNIIGFNDHCPAHPKELISLRNIHTVSPSQHSSSSTTHGSKYHQVHEAAIQEEVGMSDASKSYNQDPATISSPFWIPCIFLLWYGKQATPP
jgi:hypothetical protein